MKSFSALSAVILLSCTLSAQAIVSSFPVAPSGTAFVGALEYDCSGDIVWIGDETNDTISAYTGGGAFLKSYAAVPPPNSTLSNPQPIGLGLNSTTGNLWVGDEGEYVYELDPTTGVPTGVSWSTSPAVTDVSGVAVDPITGNIFVSQDSGTRMIVEFDTAGNVVSTIALASSGSMDPDGLAYDLVSDTFFLGEDTGDSVIQVDRAGAAVNTFNLSGLGISPEGLGLDPTSGNLIIGDGFVTGSVFVVSGVAPMGACVPNPTPLAIAATTTGAGDINVGIFNIPSGTVEGWTFISLDTSAPVGTGSIFGFEPDMTTNTILAIAPVATPGDPLHWTWPVTAPTYPAAPFVGPPGTTTAFAGQTWDFFTVAVTANAAIPSFNVSRVTW